MISILISWYPLHILLTRRNNIFWSGGVRTFWCEGIRRFWAQKSYKKNQYIYILYIYIYIYLYHIISYITYIIYHHIYISYNIYIYIYHLLTCTNATIVLDAMNKCQQLYHIILQSCINQEQIVLQKAKYQQLYYIFFESSCKRGHILMHGHNYQQLYHIVFDSCSSQEWTSAFHHFLYTHFLSLISIWNIHYCKQQLFNCIFTHVFSLKVMRNEFLYFEWFFIIVQYLLLKYYSYQGYIHFQSFYVN